jgi:hypothetical protein
LAAGAVDFGWLLNDHSEKSANELPPLGAFCATGGAFVPLF